MTPIFCYRPLKWPKTVNYDMGEKLYQKQKNLIFVISCVYSH